MCTLNSKVAKISFVFALFVFKAARPCGAPTRRRAPPAPPHRAEEMGAAGLGLGWALVSLV